MLQIVAGSIRYSPLAIYYYEQHTERISIKKMRQLGTIIQNELRNSYCNTDRSQNYKELNDLHPYAKT